MALFAVFDGHGGEFAANYAKEKLIENLYTRVVEISDLLAGRTPKPRCVVETEPEPEQSPTALERRKSFRKTSSTTDECTTKEITDLELLSKLDTIGPITRQVRPSSRPQSFKKIPSSNYFDKFGTVNYGKLLTDEVLAADYMLLETAKKSMDVAGTTALIAILDKGHLIVANVGDSRYVIFDCNNIILAMLCLGG